MEPLLGAEMEIVGRQLRRSFERPKRRQARPWIMEWLQGTAWLRVCLGVSFVPLHIRLHCERVSQSCWSITVQRAGR